MKMIDNVLYVSETDGTKVAVKRNFCSGYLSIRSKYCRMVNEL